MWSQFFISGLIGALFIFVPGYLLLRACRLTRLIALGAAPAVSIAGYQSWSIVMAKVGIWADWVSVSIPVLVAAILCLLVSIVIAHKRGESSDGFTVGSRWLPEGKTQAVSLIAFLIVSLLVVFALFVKNLDGASSYFQAYDNLSHMLRVKASLETGWFAPIGLDMYYDLGESAPSVMHYSSFYPSGWQCIVAMTVSLLGVPISLAENAVNALFMGLVLPAGACFALCVLFRDRGRYVPFLSVLVLAFAAFPWGILNFGPLYPNLAAYAMLPSVTALFGLMFVSNMDNGPRIAIVFSFLITSLGMAYTHPNAVFVAYVFLVPFLAYRTFTWLRGMERLQDKPWVGYLGMLLVLLFFALIWIAAYHAPAFSGIVGYKNWWAFMSKHDALKNFLLLSLRDTPAQPVLALLVIIGCIYTLKHREYFWLTCSYGISAIMYAVNVSTDGFLKNLLTGFWYEDSYRICAMVALFGLPLACLGLIAVLSRINPKSGKHGVHAGARKSNAFMILAVCIIAACIYCPNFNVPGYGRVNTALGYVGDATAYRNDTSRLDDALNADEREFLQQVKEVVPEGALILNHPYDGSAFALANEDLRVYYRVLGIYNGSSQESETGKIIRLGLRNIAKDEQVRQAVDSTGAEYLLILDQGVLDSEDHRRYLISYHPENWPGISGVNDETPGFEVLLSEGDMRLYRIE